MTADTPRPAPMPTDTDPLAVRLAETEQERLDRIVHVRAFQTDTMRNIALFAAVESIIADRLSAAGVTPGCECPPCPGRGNDGHGLTHCAECCFGSMVEADEDCPKHGRAAVERAAGVTEARAENDRSLHQGCYSFAEVELAVEKALSARASNTGGGLTVEVRLLLARAVYSVTGYAPPKNANDLSLVKNEIEHVAERIKSDAYEAGRLAAGGAAADEGLRERIEALRADVEHSRQVRDEDPVITRRDGMPADVGALLRIALDAAPAVSRAADTAAEEARDEASIWDEAVREMHDLGWLHDWALSDGLARNPYRSRDDEEAGS